MEASDDRIEFWKGFILERCGFPAPDRLRAQFGAAVVSGRCGCGCQSFSVTVPGSAEVPPLADGSGFVFQAMFRLGAGDETLDVALFADEKGDLCEVEIDRCANGHPVPDDIDVRGPPFRVWASEALLR